MKREDDFRPSAGQALSHEYKIKTRECVNLSRACSSVTVPTIALEAFVYTRAVFRGGGTLWQRNLRDFRGSREA
jgi:hypothetical protein